MIEMKELELDGVEYDSFVDKTSREHVANLNYVVLGILPEEPETDGGSGEDDETTKSDYIFNSDEDEFKLGSFSLKGQSYNDGTYHIPQVIDLTGKPVTVRIKSYNSNGVESERTSHTLYMCQYSADVETLKETLYTSTTSNPYYISGTRDKLPFYNVTADGKAGTSYHPDMWRIEKKQAGYEGGGVVTLTHNAEDKNALVLAEGAKSAVIFNIYDGVDLDIKLWYGTMDGDPALIQPPVGDGAGDDNEEITPQPNGLVQKVANLENEMKALKDDIAEDNTDPELAEDVATLNDTLFETVDLNPSINLWNPATAYTRVSENKIDGGTELLTSATIPCKSGDAIYVRAKQADGTIATTGNVQCYRFVDADGNKNEPRCNISHTYTVPETVSGLGEIVGVEVGIQTAWLTTNEKTAADIMVTINKDYNKKDFVEWHENNIVTRDRITPLKEQVDGLSATVARVAPELPDYWVPHLNAKIARVRELQRAGGKDCYSFIAMADFHHSGSNEDVVASEHSPQMIKRIADACNIKYCLCLGDIQSGGALETKELMDAHWDEIHDIFAPIRDITLFTPGNHDGAYGKYDKDGNGKLDTLDNYVYNLPRTEMYDRIFRSVSKIPGVVFNDTGDAYYVDDSVAKVRYLLMNTQWVPNDDVDGNGCNLYTVMRHGCLGQSQLNFAVEALKSLPDEDWHVVTGGHYPITQVEAINDGGGRDLSLFRDMLCAFQKRTTFTRTYGTKGEYNYVSLDVDFTDAKGCVAGAFAGHVHNDYIFTDFAFPIILHTADACGSFKEGGSIGAKGKAGTITERAFDVVTVDKKKGKIYLTKVGLGQDREVDLKTPS